MLIGVPTEIKNHEYRVGLTPESVAELIHNGHTAIVQSGAGDGIGCSDADYKSAGAEIVADASTVFERADMIVKVKEPQKSEYTQLRRPNSLHLFASCSRP
jgi:alanine dehydrogenase